MVASGIKAQPILASFCRLIHPVHYAPIGIGFATGKQLPLLLLAKKLQFHFNIRRRAALGGVQYMRGDTSGALGVALAHIDFSMLIRGKTRQTAVMILQFV